MKEKPKRSLTSRYALIGTLLIPAGFLYFFSKGTQNFTPPSYFGPMEAVIENGQPTGDSTHYQIHDFSMTLEDGSTATLDAFKNKIIVAFVIGTSCPSDCEVQMEAVMSILWKKLNSSSYDDVVLLAEFVSYDEDETPSFDKIHSYYDKVKTDDKWQFFTSEVNEFYNYPAYKNGPNMYSSHVSGARNGKGYYNVAVLIDKDRHVRGIYNLKRSSAYARDLMDGIKLLKKAELYE